ncbi:PTS sugar transporter subunit IIA [Oleomonas cavernae]
MDLSSIIGPEGVIAGLKTATKKQALQELAARAAEITGVHERTIFDILLERERLGTTGVGQGIAIPHGKLAEIDRLFGLFARLDQPIDFESIDEQPVDLIFLLLAPRAPVPITSRPWPRSRACCATATPAKNCATATRSKRSTRCSPNPASRTQLKTPRVPPHPTLSSQEERARHRALKGH